MTRGLEVARPQSVPANTAVTGLLFYPDEVTQAAIVTPSSKSRAHS